MPSLGALEAHALTRTAVFPYFNRQEPLESCANFPTSTSKVLPAISFLKTLNILYYPPFICILFYTILILFPSKIKKIL